MTAGGAGGDGCETSARIAHAMAGQRHRGTGRSRSAAASGRRSCTAGARYKVTRSVRRAGCCAAALTGSLQGPQPAEEEVMDNQPPNTTTDAGSPVASDEYSLTAS